MGNTKVCIGKVLIGVVLWCYGISPATEISVRSKWNALKCIPYMETPLVRTAAGNGFQHTESVHRLLSPSFHIPQYKQTTKSNA